MFSKVFRSALVAFLLAGTAAPARADLVFATWNIDGGEQTPADLGKRVALLQPEVGRIDVLVLQEVISEEQVAAIAAGMGLDHWAISDFSPPIEITGKWYKSLELAVVSRLPIEGAAEWDPTGPRPTGDGYAPRASLGSVSTTELSPGVVIREDAPSRGFLRADLEDGWSVYAVHWKSSRGASCNAEDMANARQRENQAAGLVSNARDALDANRTIVVAGDFNIQAPGKALRVGTSSDEDCSPEGDCEGVCGPAEVDGYDDSISMLLGLDGARLLSTDLPHTYVGRFYPGGAIDHLLVAGPRAGEFLAARTPEVKGRSYLGSDHRPVLATVREQ